MEPPRRGERRNTHNLRQAVQSLRILSDLYRAGSWKLRRRLARPSRRERLRVGAAVLEGVDRRPRRLGGGRRDGQGLRAMTAPHVPAGDAPRIEWIRHPTPLVAKTVAPPPDRCRA